MSLENEANEAYYNSEEPIITDQEFNLLSDTGMEIENFRNKTNHFQPMGSLKKIKTEEDYIKFCKDANIRKLTPKLDGNSIELVYVDKILTKAITRGDGFVGNDITDKIRHCNILYKPNQEGMYSVKCEAIMPKIYQRVYEKNIRNVVAGTLNRKSIDRVELSKIHIVVFEDLNDLNDMWDNCALSELEIIFNEAKENYKYEIDGLVIELDEQIHEEKDPLLPANIVALKFNKEGVDAEVGKINWHIGKHGRLTPVLELKETVEIDGTNVRYVSASNYGLVRTVGLNVGAKVKVIKSGDIIPFISEVVSKSQEHLMVPTCPVCSCVSHISMNAVHATCENPWCRSKKLIKLQHIFKIFDLEYISDSTIESLYNYGYTTLGMIFSLSEKQIAELPGFGKRKAANVVSKLKNIELTEDQFLQCAMVKGISSSQSKKLIDHFGTLLGFLDSLWNQHDIIKIDSFGDVLAKTVQDERSSFYDMYDELIGCGVNIKEKLTIDVPTKENIVFTGKCDKYGRKELTKILVDLGYNVQSGINKDTDILLVGEVNSGSSKIKKAEKFGTTITEYNDFFNKKEIN